MSRIIKKSPGKGREIEKPKSSRSLVQLPTSLSEPIEDVSDLILMIYGEKKIGKTSFCTEFPKCLQLMFEPGSKGIRGYTMKCYGKSPSFGWKQFKKILDILIQGNHDYRTVAIDTVDLMYASCLRYVCDEQGMDHPSDKTYGKGWDAVKKELTSEISRLTSTDLGLIFLSHAVERTFKERTGGEHDKIVSSMPGQAAELFSGLSDVIGYYGYYGNQRLMTITGSDELESGHRMEENFLVKGTDLDDPERVHSIPMGHNKKEAFENFVAAFNNQQETDGKPRRHKETVLSNKRVMKSKKS